jgi:hypothetical protein
MALNTINQIIQIVNEDYKIQAVCLGIASVYLFIKCKGVGMGSVSARL